MEQPVVTLPIDATAEIIQFWHTWDMRSSSYWRYMKLIDPIEERRKAYMNTYITVGFTVLAISYFLYGVFFR